MTLTTGQNIAVPFSTVQVRLTTENKLASLAIDHSIFLLNADGKVGKDEDFIFFNNPDRADVGIIHNPANGTTELDLAKVPADIVKIVFALTISDGVDKNQCFRDVGAAKLTVLDKTGGAECAVFDLTTADKSETALIMGELYQRNDQWKFRAIGQGFNGGLQPLAELYGVDIGEGESNPADVPAEPVPPPCPAPPPPSLSKTPINLKKSGEKATISLAKGAKVTARLKWDTEADLDLYCFYVDEAGNESKVYYRNLGSLTKPPFIQLLGDSKIAGEEVVEISKPDKVRYALIAAYSAISNGVGSFYSYQARCVITDNDGQTITTHLAHQDPYSYWVALARIDFSTAGKLTIENVETYSNEATFLQQFEQRTGGKPGGGWFRKGKVNVNGVDSYDPERSPYLFKDGSFMMSVGEAEFKDFDDD